MRGNQPDTDSPGLQTLAYLKAEQLFPDSDLAGTLFPREGHRESTLIVIIAFAT